MSPKLSPTHCRQRLSPAMFGAAIGAQAEMAKVKAKGKIDFIFQRKGADNWWVKLRSGGKGTERSLGTPDRQLADVLAAPMVADHKARLLEARPRIEPTWQHELAPGREHVSPDGGRIFATDRELYHLDARGITIRTTPNGGPAF